MFDLLIKEGNIVDGTGNPRYKSDIGILGDKIVFIGNSDDKESKQTINAKGLIVSPGFIDTDMTKILDEKIRKNYLESIPLNRFGKPYEVAKLVRFICSNEADYITGQTINIDGGIIM